MNITFREQIAALDGSDTVKYSDALKIAARADAEITQLRADAERYRFLRSCNIDMRNRLEHYADSALDTAIDAARGGE